MSKTKKNSELSTAELSAQSVLKAKGFIEVLDVAEEMGRIGTWLIPDKEKEDWHFTRFNRQVAYHREQAALLHKQGYFFCYDQPSLRNTRYVGFENDGGTGNLNGDGGNGLYMCCPPATYLFLQEAKASVQAMMLKNVREDLGGTLGALRGQLGRDSIQIDRKEIRS